MKALLCPLSTTPCCLMALCCSCCEKLGVVEGSLAGFMAAFVYIALARTAEVVQTFVALRGHQGGYMPAIRLGNA
jgi:hypothetical protein